MKYKRYNNTEKFSAKEFDFNSDVRKVYCLIYGEDSLKKAIEREHLLESNRIYSIDYALKTTLEKIKLKLI